MDYWIWSLLLLSFGLGLAVVEVFFPSAGMLGFLSFCAIIGAIAMGFQQGTGTGMVIVGIAVIGVPTVIAMALKVWPKTAMGRRIFLTVPNSHDVLPDSPHTERLKGLIGQLARAKSTMLPAGAISIDGRTIDAVSEGMPIEAGQNVRIVEVRANRVVVRLVEGEVPVTASADPLLRPIEDPFGDPLA